MRLLAKILGGFLSLLLLLAGGVYWYLSTLDVSDYREDLAAAVKQATGRNLAIAGELSIEIFPAPKIVAEGLALSNADWGSQPNFVTVSRLEAEISPADLLKGTVAVNRITVLGPVVFLETNAKGKGNWILSAGKSEKVDDSKTSGGLSVDISNVEIRDARVNYRDGVTEKTRVADIKELLVRSGGWVRPLVIEMRGQFDERDFELTGQTGSLAAFLDDDAFHFNLLARVQGNELAAEGEIKESARGRGLNAKIFFKSPNLGKFIGVFGIASGLTFPLEVNGSVRSVDNGYLAENMKLKSGKSYLSGELSYLTVNGRPHIRSSLQSTLVDLDEFSAGSEKQKSDRVIPVEPLPVVALRSVDADISVKASRVIFTGLEVSAVTVDLKLRNGRLELTPRGGLYGGEWSGRVGLDAAVERPRFAMNLKGERINLGALVNALQKSDVLSGGPTELNLKLKGVGTSLREIASSADGLLVTIIGPGKIHTSAVDKVGADAVMQAVRAASGEEQADYTSFQCGVARFDVKKGKAVTKKGIAVEGDNMNVVGSGSVNLGTEDIDIAIKTEPREGAGLSVSSVGLAIRIGGTMADPKTSVDPLGAAKAGASAAAAVATGGLSLLAQGLFSRATADETPCDTALGIKKKTAKRTGGTSQQPTDASASGDGASPSSPVDAIKGVGDAIKGLFGN